MARIAGIQFNKAANGTIKSVTIDYKKHGEKIKPLLQDMGALEGDDFEKKWNEGGYQVEEARALLLDKVKNHSVWKAK